MAGLAVLLVLALVASACIPIPGGTGIADRSLINDVKVLASDEFRGRDNDDVGGVLAREYLIKQLKKMSVGLDASRSGDDAFRQEIPGGVNVLGLMRGSVWPDQYIIVGGHYDHMAPGRCREKITGDEICNGATDNATGAAAVLAVGRAIKARYGGHLRRSVILALWDREEDGLLGSQHYVNNPIVPLSQTIAYVNFDIQGANLLPSLRNISFALGGETGGPAFDTIVRQSVQHGRLDTQRLSQIFGQNRSDYINFINKQIPTVFFSDSTGPCYHTTQDEFAIVDFSKLARQTEIAIGVVRRLAEVRRPPAFVPATPIATYDDAKALAHVTNTGFVDLDRFPEPQRSQLLQWNEDLNRIVAEGEAAFDAADVGTMLGGAASAISILTLGPCDGFLAP
jgi:hypothetical protein